MRPNFLPLLALILLLPSAEALANEIQNPSFDLNSTLIESFPSQFQAWGGDEVSYRSAENGITPRTGSRMLGFDSAAPNGPGGTGSSCELYQLVDVSTRANAGGALAEASFYVNRLDEPQIDSRFFLRLYSLAGTPDTLGEQLQDMEYLQFDQVELISDADPSTWEQLVLSVTLPTGTDFVALAIVANENVSNDLADEFLGNYADDVSLTIVEPLPTESSSWSKLKALF